MDVIKKVFNLLSHNATYYQKAAHRPVLDEKPELPEEELPETIDFNDEFKSAFEAMENTSDYVFITGKAGTGKSTLLRYFQANTKKKVVVLAPTGVASINVGGQTIHSFFKFPPRLIQKDIIRRRRNGAIIEKLDAVIIDEISMVRADLMDGIDYALRINRDEMSKPFGGAQIILFGDLFQLPPVVEREAKEIIEEKYPSPYFFSAKVFEKINIRYIELTKIYRQTDGQFVDVLNRLRSKEHTEEDFDILNSRVQKNIDMSMGKTVILTTTNNLASSINMDRLVKLPTKEFSYEAAIFGEFDESAYPTDLKLRLKKDAQVILIKNDPGKRWVNGTIAKVSSLSNDFIKVDIDGKICDVPKIKWQKIEYVYNKEKDKIEENVIGTFEQYPLKLAWAITIHKSQGQTFNKVIIDLGDGAFTHGQVYVALSRCTTMEGITLRKPVIESDIIFDRRIHEFKNRCVRQEN